MCKRTVGFSPESLSLGFAIGAITLIAVTFSGGSAAASRASPDPSTPPTPSAKPTKANPPYCGIYSVFGALRSLGRKVEFEWLLVPRYIGSKQGSSAVELTRAAEDFGARATVISGLSHASVEDAQWPMILHVAGKGVLREYDHWVLFLGVKNGQALIADAPDPVRAVPLASLMASWDGTAIVISNRPLSSSTLMSADHWMLLNYITSAATCLLLAWLALRRGRSSFGRRWQGKFGCPGVTFQLGVVLAIGCVLSLGVHCLSPIGFLRNPAAASSVAASTTESFFPKLSVDDVYALVQAGGVVLIDARHRSDYDRGHLPGAISVPVNSTSATRGEILEDVPKDLPAVVYCQSRNCPFDETVAVELARDGFRDIKLFVGGWREWEKSKYHGKRNAPDG
jgi:rhodanese-related sulfurtransferase